VEHAGSLFWGVDHGGQSVLDRGGGRARQNGGVTATALTQDEREGRERELNDLLDLMRPAVQADGGDLVLTSVDVELGLVEVQLQGACSSCAISAVTLQGGVERILRERLPWVTEVRGGVDESMDPTASMAMGQGGYMPKW
jgi:Fe-S cluster biogenesis protein NfuA